MKFEIKNRWTGTVQVVAEIECEATDSYAIKLGRAVRWAIKNDADLFDANLDGANLDGADLFDANLYRANLTGANLDGASLDGANGINDYVKCIQIDTYPITYTAEVIQIGCERHTHQEWAEFDDEHILNMDGRKALTWWRKYKTWLFQTIEMCPAQPTGFVADEATAAE